MTATVIQIAVQRMVCTACGAEANASCTCGKPYVPAKERAAKAIAENPQKSDRAIAAEIGVSHPTVAKARKESTGNNLPVDEPRIGLDGKARKQPVNPRGMTQKRRLRGFEVSIDLLCNCCEQTENNLTDKKCMPAHLTDEEKAEAMRRLTEAISSLQRMVECVAKMERAP